MKITYIKYAFSSFLILLVIVLFFKQYNAKTIGVIDLQKIISAESTSVSSAAGVDLNEKAGAFNKLLVSAIYDISIKHNVVLLVDPAVVGPAEDYTNLVVARMTEIQGDD